MHRNGPLTQVNDGSVVFCLHKSFLNVTLLDSDQCALRLDGSLKDASEISWVHDPDDEIPVASGSLPGM